MTLAIQEPGGGPDVTRRNKRGLIYITTDSTADNSLETAPENSIRIAFTPGDTSAHIEKFLNGVWNDTGFRFASSSVGVGRDMTISAVAGHLETLNPSAAQGHTRGLIPHIEFNDFGTVAAETPIVNQERDFVVYSGAVSEIIATTIGINLGTVPSRIIEFSEHEVGTVGSSAPVTVKFFTGSDNTGFLFNEKRLAANALVANTQLKIPYDLDLGFEGGISIFMEFTSTANFSLKTDIGGNPLTTHEAHELDEVGILTENLMIDEDLNLMFDLELNPVYAIQFADL